MILSIPPFSGSRSIGAFSLVEVTIALGVAAFCLLSIFGLLPVGMKSNQTSVEQTAAASLARAVIADLRNTPAGTANSPVFGFNVPSAGTAYANPQTAYLREDGTLSLGKKVGDAPVPGEARYRVSLAINSPGAGLKTATAVRVLVTWPALADSNPSAWPANFSGSFETVTALDRN